MSRYSLPIAIALFTAIALVFTLVGVKLMGLTPYFAGALGVGFGALFQIGLLVIVQYGSTIDPDAPEEYDESNDFTPEEL